MKKWHHCKLGCTFFNGFGQLPQKPIPNTEVVTQK